MDNGPDWVILLMYWSHDMRHTSFRRLTMVNETLGIGASQNESCDIEWSFGLDDQLGLQRFDHRDVNPEVINNNILSMRDRNDDGDDDFICDGIMEEDFSVDSANNVEEWLSSESKSD